MYNINQFSGIYCKSVNYGYLSEAPCTMSLPPQRGVFCDVLTTKIKSEYSVGWNLTPAVYG